nr:hypothetical protein [Oscillochloris trichoides]
MPLALVQRHTNSQLFADRYLDEILPRRDAWRDLITEATPVLAQVRAILAAFTPSSKVRCELRYVMLMSGGYATRHQHNISTGAAAPLPPPSLRPRH